MHAVSRPVSPGGDPIGDARADADIPVFARRIGSWRVSLHRQPLTGDELARSYDGAAGNWHRTVDRLNVPRSYEALLTPVVEQTAADIADRSLRVLECGVGTGALSSALLRVAEQPIELHGVDFSAGMLAEAGRRFEADGVSACLKQADVRRLPYDNGAFDLVMAAHLLEHLSAPETALRELTRVTRPGGRVLVCVTRRTLFGFWIHLKWRTHMLGRADAEDWLARAGLRDVRRLEIRRRGLLRHLSIAVAGIKPEPCDETSA